MAKRPVGRRAIKKATIPQRVMDQAQQLYSQGDYANAQRVVHGMLQKQPGHPFLLYFYGSCLVQTEHYEEGIEALEESLKHPKARIDGRKPLAACYRMLGNLERAHQVLDEGLKKEPGNEPLLASKADLLLAEGRNDDAEVMLRPVMEKGFEDHNLALAWGTLCKQSGRHEEAIPVLEPYWKNTSLPPAMRTTEMFLLAQIYDRLGRHEEAWRVVTEANALRKGTHNRLEHRQSIDRMISSFSPSTWERLARAEHPGTSGPRPFFIVGLPRSGTTLTEQIIASHSQVAAGGELPTIANLLWRTQSGMGIGVADIPQHPTMYTAGLTQRLSDEYLAKLAEVDADAKFVTDKMPMNITRVPFIRMLFPDAPIIRCRRHILDTAISCWFQNFGTGAGFVYDIESLAEYIADCHRAEKHYTEALGVEVIPLDYEDVVDDLEGSARKLVITAGLEWEDACLRYYENVRDVRTASQDQVRKPIYKSSVERWKKYGDLINPLVEALERNGVDPYASG